MILIDFMDSAIGWTGGVITHALREAVEMMEVVQSLAEQKGVGGLNRAEALLSLTRT